MNEVDALDLVRSAMWTILIASAPAIVPAMVVGIAIALLQALTQVQEMTLTFIPKIAAILIMIIVGGPFIGSQMQVLTTLIYGRIENGF
ncbi:flagellar biosynthesis protein FliQ [Roseibium sp. RKSG952]|uniref:flagellar biosynthesis protein FliQ n=1 Tax=Roseibium sp. RKSG952 TaxID=2529384 RepID=UPI0012BBAF22|nr:flagellar biosynthesis protein FliQ [Roseibium sp. RKSG952]MTH98277.1 flagellar biosynthetic protein FliQ [Roseibium sp. RKSG952]